MASAFRLPDPVRLGLFYGLLFAGTGVSLPYIGLWMADQGLDGAEIGAILAAPMLARFVTAPLIAVWADGFRLRRAPLAILAAVAAGAYALLGLGQGFAAWFVAWFAGATAISACIPLGDVLTLRRAKVGGFQFARPRSVGSIAFVVANVVMGGLLASGSTDLVLVWILSAAALMALACAVALPAEPVHEGEARPDGRDRFRGLGRLLADPWFMVALLAFGLIQAAHGFYYGFSALVWTEQGLPKTVTGLLWATGVAAEIVFLWFFEPWRRRFGPWALLSISGVAAVARWGALALSPPLWALWPLQALHAFTFAAGYMASLQIIERLSPRESASAAQTLSSALSSGVLTGLATMLSGALFDRYGAYGYLAMAAMGAAGLAAAWPLRARLRPEPWPA